MRTTLESLCSIRKTKMQKNILSYCGQLVKTHDPDRYLLSMFAPSSAREDVWALFAFHYEIAKTREVVSESTLGLIRLQWWRDEITRIYSGHISSHEVLGPLGVAIKRHELPKEHFETLLYAREFDLEDVSPANPEGLMNYADFTGTPLLKLLTKICGGDESAEPAQLIAINYGLVGLMRAVPSHARQGRCFLPEDLMQKYGLEKEKLFAHAPQEGMSSLVKECLEKGYHGGAKPNLAILKAYSALAEIYLRQIKALEYDVFSSKMKIEPSFKVLRLVLKINFI